MSEPLQNRKLMKYNAPPSTNAGPKVWASWKLHTCPDGEQCRAEIPGGCASDWCAEFGISPEATNGSLLDAKHGISGTTRAAGLPAAGAGAAMLTDEDRAAIARITGGGAGPIDRAIYLAGLRAGLKRAASVCDERRATLVDHRKTIPAIEAGLAAAAIRALGDET